MNHKGGVGKTTTAVNASVGLAKKGRPTLLVDLDSQAHSTYDLGIARPLENASIPSIADVMLGGRPLANSIVETRLPMLKLVPSEPRLASVGPSLYTRNFREQVLGKALAPVKAQFDYIVLDCPPALDVLGINALVAADKLLVPIGASGHALRGFADLLSVISAIKGDDPAFDFRLLLTGVTGAAKERQASVLAQLEPFKERILRTSIRRSEAIEGSQLEVGQEVLTPVILQKKWSKGARDYRLLVKEIQTIWP